jgi:hypothetical protein
MPTSEFYQDLGALQAELETLKKQRVRPDGARRAVRRADPRVRLAPAALGQPPQKLIVACVV